MNDQLRQPSNLLYLFTRTPMHLGAGSSVGALDQPIQRERHTGFPLVPGSSIKGVLRFSAEKDPEIGLEKAENIFGAPTKAGAIAIGEGRILAFPVRSARGSFAFITCPLALERFRREHGALDKFPKPITKPQDEPGEMQCLAGDKVAITRAGQSGVVLEEYRFNLTGPFPTEWEEALLSLLDDTVWQVGKGRFVLLSNGDFSHFVRTACEVNQHVRIGDETGTAEKGGLFDLEAVPAETLFFAPFTSLARENGEMAELKGLFNRKPLFQFGGDATTGLGFCTVKLG